MATGKILTSLLMLLTLENSMAGKAFSEQGNALYKSLISDLINKGICSDNKSCSDVLQIYGEDGKRIYMNMYGQKDMRVSSIVAKFFVEQGIKITGGIPITLSVYSHTKEEDVASYSLFSKPKASIKLEINK